MILERVNVVVEVDDDNKKDIAKYKELGYVEVNKNKPKKQSGENKKDEK